MSIVTDIFSFFQNADWLNVIMGAILGALLTNIHYFLSIAKRLFHDPDKNYYGKYYIYNYSVSEYGEISKKICTIKKGLFSGPKVRMSIEGAEDRDFIGRINVSENDLFIHLSGVNHGIFVQMVFHAPLTKKIECLEGVFAGAASNRNPVSGKVIISNKELSIPAILSRLGENKQIIVTNDHLLQDSDLNDCAIIINQ